MNGHSQSENRCWRSQFLRVKTQPSGRGNAPERRSVPPAPTGRSRDGWTAGARLGLKPGDLVISIDAMRFTTYDGFVHALQCASQRPSFIVCDVRTQRLIRRSIDLPHAELPSDQAVPRFPDCYLMSIDLAGDIR